MALKIFPLPKFLLSSFPSHTTTGLPLPSSLFPLISTLPQCQRLAGLVLMRWAGAQVLFQHWSLKHLQKREVARGWFFCWCCSELSPLRCSLVPHPPLFRPCYFTFLLNHRSHGSWYAVEGVSFPWCVTSVDSPGNFTSAQNFSVLSIGQKQWFCRLGTSMVSFLSGLVWTGDCLTFSVA